MDIEINNTRIEFDRDASRRWTYVYGTCASCRSALKPDPLFGFADNTIEDAVDARVFIVDRVIEAIEHNRCSCHGVD